MPSVNEERFQAAWQELLALERDDLGNVRGNPIAIVGIHFQERYDLAVSSAHSSATVFVRKLIDDGYIIPCRTPGPGRNGGTISSFNVTKMELLIFPTEEEGVKEEGDEHGKDRRLNENGNVDEELRQGLVEVKIGISEIKELLTVERRKAFAKTPKVAIWIDGPNITYCSQEADVEPPIGHLIDQAKRCGELRVQFVFHNTGVPESIVRAFELKGCTSIVCTRPKAVREDGHDPVDAKMASLIQEMVDIADVHFIVTEDRDAEPILAFIRKQTGKSAIRAFVAHPEGALVIDKGRDELPIRISLRKLSFVRQR